MMPNYDVNILRRNVAEMRATIDSHTLAIAEYKKRIADYEKHIAVAEALAAHGGSN